jgi:hypothetical protein
MAEVSSLPAEIQQQRKSLEMNSMTYPQYIKDKRVVFVGPSPILEGRGMGKDIESFDVVVKTGPAAHITRADYWRDYGRRIDVLYCNTEYCRNVEPHVMEYKSLGIKYIRARKDNKQELLSKHFDFGMIDTKFVNEIFKDSLALMGTIAMLEILQCEPKELHITGVDWNTARGNTLKEVLIPEWNVFKEHVADYLTPELKSRINHHRESEMQDSHNPIYDARLAKELYNSGKITLPDFVAEKLDLLLAMK